MDKKSIIKYIKAHEKIEMPDLQERFGLEYTDAIKILSDLEKRGTIKYCDGYTYEYIQKTSEKPGHYVPKDKIEAMNIKALWECIKADKASTITVIRSCSYGYNESAQAIDWMEKEGYVSAAKSDGTLRDVLISREDFIKKFGNMEDKRLFSKYDDADFNEEFDEDSDDDLYSFDEKADDYDYMEELDKKRKELEARKERILKEIADREEKDKESNEHGVEGVITNEIRDKIKQLPNYNAEDDTFSTKMTVSYPNGVPFRIKLINSGGALYLSDCGNTIEFLSALNDPEELKSYLRKSCANTRVCLVGNDICTEIKNVRDLTDESDFLFRIVNILVTQEYFDMYYLSKELMHLSNKIFVRKDAKLLVKALVVSDKKVKADVLQKCMNIRLSTANGIIDTLMELYIISPDGTKNEKITAAFIAYLKHVLDNV